MASILDQARGGGPGELRFRLGGVPVRVHPWFWIGAVFLGLSDDLGSVVVWVAVVFISILVHEFGHVTAFRFFGVPAEVMLWAFGGLAIPHYRHRRGPGADIAISAAGPGAGFCFAAVVVALAIALGGRVDFGLALGVIPVFSTAMPGSVYANLMLNDLLYVNIYWGLVNLLPIHPLDGGHIARALFEQSDPARGRRRALWLSAAVAAGVAGLGLLAGSLYLMVLFALLAVSSVQAAHAVPRG
jgi:Zn-dependent protease